MAAVRHRKTDGLGAIPAGVEAAATWPSTAAACARAGWLQELVAGESNAKALAAVVVAHLKGLPGDPCSW